jgi:hypothetical protein
MREIWCFCEMDLWGGLQIGWKHRFVPHPGSPGDQNFGHGGWDGAAKDKNGESCGGPTLKQFLIHVDFLNAAKGGFFLMKKPLECVLSVYTNSEAAIATKTKAWRWPPQRRRPVLGDPGRVEHLIGSGWNGLKNKGRWSLWFPTHSVEKTEWMGHGSWWLR